MPNSRKHLNPFSVIGNDGIHCRLLQHDFRNPDFIGITAPTPGKIASMLAVPRIKVFREGWFLFHLFQFGAALTELREEGCFVRTIFVLYAVSIYCSK